MLLWKSRILLTVPITLETTEEEISRSPVISGRGRVITSVPMGAQLPVTDGSPNSNSSRQQGTDS